MASDITSNLPNYDQLVQAASSGNNQAGALNSGLSGLLTGMQLKRQANADKAARMDAAEKALLERAKAYQDIQTAQTAQAREGRLAANELQKSKDEKDFRDSLLQLKRDELEYKKKLLDAHKGANPKDLLKLQSAFYTAHDAPIEDAQAALDEFSQKYEDAIKEGSVGLGAGAKAQLESLASGGALKPKFSTFRKATKTLVPSLQKGLGINRTSTAEINALTKGVPSGYEDANVGRQFIKTVQDVLDRKKRENQKILKGQLEILKTGNLPDISTFGEEPSPMNTPIDNITRPPLETFMDEDK